MKKQTQQALREAQRLYRGALIAPITDKHHLFDSIAKRLETIEDDCHLAMYRIEKLTHKLKKHEK